MRYIFFSLFLSLFFFSSCALAEQTNASSSVFTLKQSSKKITKSFDSNAITFSFLPKGIKRSAVLTVEKKSPDALLEKEHHDDYLEPVSEIYSFVIEKNNALIRPMTISFFKKDTKGIYIYFYDFTIGQWTKITTIRNKTSLSTSLFSSRGMVALFRERAWVANEHVIPLNMPARGLYVVDQDSNVLLSKNHDRKLPLASITKLMTALVFLDHNPGWDARVKITKGDDTLPAKVPYFEGAVVTTKDLFYCMLVGSRNNCATALARSTGLSEKEFIKQMNAKTYDFGLSATSFADTSGLDPKNISTAKEFSIITQAAFNQEDIRNALLARTYTMHFLNDTKRMYGMKNTNLLLREPIKGITMWGKTGYIEEAGFTFATQGNQGEKTITVIVLGAPDSDTRFRISKMLLEKGLHGTLAKRKPAVARKI